MVVQESIACSILEDTRKNTTHGVVVVRDGALRKLSVTSRNRKGLYPPQTHISRRRRSVILINVVNALIIEKSNFCTGEWVIRDMGSLYFLSSHA